MAAILAPAINAVLARGHEPAASIGGYAVAFGIIGLIALPQMRVQQLTLVFLDDRISLARLRRFVAGFALIVGAVALAVALTPLADLLLEHVFALRGPLREEARLALLGLAPFAPLAVVRTHLYGTALRFGRSRLVWVGTTIGVGGVLVLSLVFLTTGALTGALVTAVAVSVAAAAETGFLVVATGRALRVDVRAAPDPAGIAGYAQLTRFFGPLLFASFLPTVTPPIISAALARAPDPELSIVAVSVALSVNQFLIIGLWGVQSTMLALLAQGDDPRRITRLAHTVGALTLVPTMLVAFLPPLSDLVLQGVMGATGRLAADPLLGIRILGPLPLLLVQEAIYASALMRSRRTRPIFLVNLWRLATLIIYVLIALNLIGAPGVVVGVGAMAAALIVEAIATYLYGRRVMGVLGSAWRPAAAVSL